jgi:hypothetical protein
MYAERFRKRRVGKIWGTYVEIWRRSREILRRYRKILDGKSREIGERYTGRLGGDTGDLKYEM